MSKSSELFLKITNQPVAFCPNIDLEIEALSKHSDEIQRIYDLNDISLDEKIELYKALIPVACKPTHFEDLILDMKSWFTGWQSILNNEILKEKNSLFKNQIESESIFFESQIKSFENRINYFKLMHKECIENYQYEISNFNKSIESYKKNKSKEGYSEEQISCIDKSMKTNFYLASSDIEDCVCELSKNYEYLRFTNSNFRDYINNELKPMAKIQLTRNKDEMWMDFLNQKTKTDVKLNLISLSKNNYMIKTERESY